MVTELVEVQSPLRTSDIASTYINVVNRNGDNMKYARDNQAKSVRYQDIFCYNTDLILRNKRHTQAIWSVSTNSK